ncbi:hypothetical protein PSU4_40410 [Pseudonocardia sulfidoxydans NBRC 16205]|uniref:PRC-barrel domain-containing protein n=2 Tax=Pseudonocardia sulfidoxydans TaxID=54011 RepID=A0A511DL03_9PSEU|nr:hypothetical protein [Pseudonocardia sulfidoxydans]GEL25087.1 hypothetical protein PSU4_40410 [Pseudonocardia sulfidoxydans NBRC 16205]
MQPGHKARVLGSPTFGSDDPGPTTPTDAQPLVGPGGPAAHEPPRAADPSLLWLTRLLGAAVLGPAGEHLGHVRDLGITRTGGGTFVDAVLVDGGGHHVTLPAEALVSMRYATVRVREPRKPTAASRLSIEPQREWLARSVLGRPTLAGSTQTPATRVRDVGLRRNRDGRWMVSSVDTRPAWLRRLGFPRRTTPWPVSTTAGRFRSRPRRQRGRRHVDLPR